MCSQWWRLYSWSTERPHDGDHSFVWLWCAWTINIAAEYLAPKALIAAGLNPDKKSEVQISSADDKSEEKESPRRGSASCWPTSIWPNSLTNRRDCSRTEMRPRRRDSESSADTSWPRIPRSVVYGDGYRAAAQSEQALGLDELLLDHVAQYRSFIPFSIAGAFCCWDEYLYIWR